MTEGAVDESLPSLETPVEAPGAGAGDGAHDVVEVHIPARGAFLSVVRTTTAGLASRLDFTIDEIEDLRIAVDEACAMLLPSAAPDSALVCSFGVGRDAISVTVSARTQDGSLPERSTFAWTVLTALAGEVDTRTEPDGRVCIALRKQRAEPDAS